jgi:hypothetical protein
MNKRITHIPAEAMQALEHYAWPGNIRELQNFIERAVILSQGTSLEAPVRELRHVPARPAAAGGSNGGVITLADAEREAIERALEESAGKVGGANGAAGHEAHHSPGQDAQARLGQPETVNRAFGGRLSATGPPPGKAERRPLKAPVLRSAAGCQTPCCAEYWPGR